MAALDDFIAAIEHATGKPGRRVGQHVRLLCPAHDDHDPSLDVTLGQNGQPLATCRSHGCSYKAICDAIGWQPEPAPMSDEWTPRGPAVAVYDYTDATGKLLYQVCRTATKEFPQRQPDPASKSGWRWNLQGVEPVLFRLPRVLEQAAKHGRIYLCEGEKDVLAIERAGAVATCNPGGAGKWRDSYTKALRGAHVVIVADNDDPGIQHATTVAQSLAAANGAGPSSVQVTHSTHAKDAADHLASGHTLDELEPLEKLTPPPKLALVLNDFLKLDIPRPPALLGTDDETIIPGGGLVILAGMPGAGKTTLALDLVFHMVSAKPWLNMPISRPSNILLIENEGPQHKFQEKLRKKVANWEHDTQGQIHVHTLNWGSFTFRSEANVQETRAYLDENNIDIVIGDPLDTLGPQGVGSPEDTRAFVASLVPLGLTAERTFLFLHHFRKEVSANEINQVSGAWGGRLDTLIVLRETERPDELRLSFPKTRHADEPAPIIIGKIRHTMGFEYLNEEVPQAANAVEETAGQIIEALRKHGGTMERPALLMRCKQTSSSGTFHRAIGKLLEDGTLAKGKDGKKTIYSLSSEAYE